MPKRVVLHHAHHPDEKVYRLIHAQADEVTQYVEVENPSYKPDEAAKLQQLIPLPVDHNGNGSGNGAGEYEQPPEFDPEIHSPTKMEERKVPVYSGHQEIVWADWDEQWKGLSDAEIAAKQRQIIKEVFAARELEQQQAAQQAQNTRQIGETEVEL